MNRKPVGRAPSLSSILRCCSVDGECRLWNGALSANGYPYVYDGRVHQAGMASGNRRVNAMVSARMLVWRLAKGPMPESKNRVVLTCCNKLCLQPDHMEAMSHGDAARFAAARGAYKTLRHRAAALRNARGTAKLDTNKADVIRHRVLVEKLDRKAVAKDFDVSTSLVDQIIRGVRWKSRIAPNASVFHQVA